MTKKLLAALFFMALGLDAMAQGEDFGKWTVVTDDPTMMYAVTFNDSGALFGQYCYPDKGSCLWLISTSTSCEKDHKYPVLANSDGGAVPLTLHCQGTIGSKGVDAKYAYVFNDFDAVTNLVKNATRIGFAMPLQADQFKVVRFEVGGSAAALAAMRSKASAAMDDAKPKHTNTRDQTL
jgi:hypothetical protein